ncbi:hypothetical protein Salat_2833300 [Sesamum alatum]|uniref:AIR9-like A9 domain-containing protein n=1 Tax=Sesamum alatum TaxID=300844 RepID=A0AAE1XLW4_9LAMI|nr:hypothetical protein Salat_2833300 [Sesamum alatum]
MSEKYDNWEKLVGAVLRREQFRELALRDSRSSSSVGSPSSSFNLSPLPSYHEHAFELPESISYEELLLPRDHLGVRGFSHYSQYGDGNNLESADDASRYVQYNDPEQVRSLTWSVEMRQLPNNENPIPDIDRNVAGHIVENIPERNGYFAGSEQRTTDQFSHPPMMHKGVGSFDSEEDGPGIEGFLIIGDAKPGYELIACGYPVRGTSLCMFQWVRHYPDGRKRYIKGATNPYYVVTANDVDKLIAVECIPMDEKGRQGVLVRTFANDHNKITRESGSPHPKMRLFKLNILRRILQLLLLHNNQSFKMRYNKSSTAEDEPGIDGLQIIGDAKPGYKLLACGYPVHGTSLCMFQWVRHYPDGTKQYIEGATNPDYVVTANDVDKLIAVECVPINDHGRHGDLVTIFANDHNKITCESGSLHKDIGKETSASVAPQYQVPQDEVKDL